ALRTIRTETRKAHFVLGVDHDCEHFLHGEPQVHAKYVAVAGNQLRTGDRRLKDFGVTIVILQEIQRLAQPCPRREYGANPVMNEPVRYVDLLSWLLGRQTLDVDLAAAQCIELRTALG